VPYSLLQWSPITVYIYSTSMFILKLDHHHNFTGGHGLDFLEHIAVSKYLPLFWLEWRR